jgi:hypothetical protein
MKKNKSQILIFFMKHPSLAQTHTDWKWKYGKWHIKQSESVNNME